MKMKQKILNNMVYIAVVAVLITTTLIGMFTYYRYMEQIKTGMKDEAPTKSSNNYNIHCIKHQLQNSG